MISLVSLFCIISPFRSAAERLGTPSNTAFLALESILKLDIVITLYLEYGGYQSFKSSFGYIIKPTYNQSVIYL